MSSAQLGYHLVRFVDPTGTADQCLFGINPEGIGINGMVLNLLVTRTVNRCTPAPPIEFQNLVEDIRFPSHTPHAST